MKNSSGGMLSMHSSPRSFWRLNFTLWIGISTSMPISSIDIVISMLCSMTVTSSSSIRYAYSSSERSVNVNISASGYIIQYALTMPCFLTKASWNASLSTRYPLRRVNSWCMNSVACSAIPTSSGPLGTNSTGLAVLRNIRIRLGLTERTVSRTLVATTLLRPSS